MRSSIRGKSTSEVEVTNIDTHGFWLLVRDKEFFLPYDEYPWFREACVREILGVKLVGEDHLHWPALDVDLSVKSLEHPESFPLTDRGLAPVGRLRRKSRT
jgi:hypothetical protein